MRPSSVFPSGRLIAATVAVVTVASCVLVTWNNRPAAAQPAAEPNVPNPIGAGGCASANCHGQIGSLSAPVGPDTWRASATIWSALDPHASATAVLNPERNEIAKRMQQSFIRSGAKPKDYTPLADHDCLACHSNPSTAGQFKQTGLQLEGIGCEGCHGNAERWQTAHTVWADVTARTAGAAATGLTDLNDYAARARQCAGCHVGAAADPARGYPVRDMNHDMIAAGHPRLLFDYPTHLLRLPKHWREKDRTRPGFPPRPSSDGLAAWLIGELAAAEAQVDLTEARATGADANPDGTSRQFPWPELAEFNCYSCHHTLTQKTWRKPAEKPGRPLWQLPWPVVDLLGEQVNIDPPDALSRQPNLAAERARKLKAAIQETRANLPRDPAGVETAMLDAIRKLADPKTPPLLWDEGYRAYLALNALDLGRGEAYPNQAEVRAGLNKLAEALFLPMHPSEIATRVNSKEVKPYTPDDVKKLLGEIVALIQN